MIGVDTRKVAGHRTLKFSTLDDALADAKALAAAERAGTLRQLGNWPLGQAIGHLAFWAERSHLGYPPKFGPPKLFAWLLKLQKQKFLNEPMRRGVKIPGVKGGTLHIEPMETEAAIARLGAAYARLKSEPPRHANIIFGPMSSDDWTRLNLRHAELHLGYYLA